MSTPAPTYWDHPDWWTDPEEEGPDVAFVAKRTPGDVVRDTWSFFRETWLEFGVGLIVMAAPLVLANALLSALFGTPHLTTAALTNVALSGFVDFAAWDEGGLRWFVQHALSVVALAVVVAGAFAYLSLYTQNQAGGITPDVLWREARSLVVAVLGVYAVLAVLVAGCWVLAQVPGAGGLLWVAGLTLLVAVGSLWTVAMAYEADTLPDGLRRVASLLADTPLARLKSGLGIVLAAAGVALAVQPAVFVLGVVARMGASVGGALGGTVLLAVEVLGLVLMPLLALPTVAATFAYGHLLALEQGTGRAPGTTASPSGDGQNAAPPTFQATPATGPPSDWT